MIWLLLALGMLVCLGLWTMLWEDPTPTVALLDPLDAELSEVYVQNMRDRERRELLHGRYMQTSLWNGVGYPSAAWIHRGRVLGLIPMDESPHPAEQNLEPSTHAGLGWKMSRQPSTN